MATAGERYEERTGNIWSYAHRGDMTGLKAAVVRGVDVNIVNTVGWTACHAAAAGGQTKALRYLVKKMGADLTISDKGGNLPAHHAAKNGHVHALRTLYELGADITRVRLSQANGKAVRDFVVESYRKAGKGDPEDGEYYDEQKASEPVGYARKQSKSTAFWGPRRTPISCAIKKKIMKDKRKLRKEKQKSKRDFDHEEKKAIATKDDMTKSGEADEEDEPSYLETVQQIKRGRKVKRRQRQRQQRAQNKLKHERQEMKDIKFDSVQRNGNMIYEAEQTESLPEGIGLYQSSDDEDNSNDFLLSSNDCFAALALTEDDSDDE